MHRAPSVAYWRMPALLDETALSAALAALPQWYREGQEIVREVKFPSYLAGVEFVQKAAQIAEEMNHHPDIYLGWRKVTLRISTHSKKGLTDLDFKFAQQVEALLGQDGV